VTTPVHALRERIMVWASEGPQRADMLAARSDFFRDTGEVREDEPCFDAYMDAFVDWFVCDHRGADGLTAAERFVRDHRGVLPAEDLAAAGYLTSTRPGLYRLDRVMDGAVVVRNLVSKESVTVTERRRMLGVTKGDVLSARLVETGGQWWFTGAPLFHPAEARTTLGRVAKAQRKKEPHEQSAVFRTISARRIRVDRYRKVSPDHHYKDLAPRRRFLFW
jgi:hypothetical protein